MLIVCKVTVLSEIQCILARGTILCVMISETFNNNGIMGNLWKIIKRY